MERLHNFEAVNRFGTVHNKPLIELATWYVADIVKGTKFSFRDLHNWLDVQKPIANQLDEIRNLVGDRLFASIKPMIMGWGARKEQEMATAMIAMHQKQHEKHGAPSWDSSGHKATTNASPFSNTATTERRVITLSEDFQQMVKKTGNKREKCELIIRAGNEIVAQKREGKTLPDDLKNWIYKAGRCIECINNCYCGSVDDFVRGESKFTPSRFVKCSKGEKHAFSCP